MAISGAFAGLGGAMDILGWQFRLSNIDIQTSQIGFIGIAVALLGRNTAIGVALASLLFGALLYGTSTRSLDPNVFAPELAGNLTLMIQALVLLFIGADLLILYLWKTRRLPRFHLPRLSFRRRPGIADEELAETIAAADQAKSAPPPVAERLRAWALARVPGRAQAIGLGAVVLAVAAAVVALPPFTVRQMAVPIAIGAVALVLGVWSGLLGQRRLGFTAAALAVIFGALGAAATVSAVSNLESVVVWSALTASTLRYATPLAFAAIGGMFSERSGVVNIGLEGMMLAGAFFAALGADQSGSWFVGILTGLAAGLGMALIHAFVSINLRADQIVSGTAINFLGLGLSGYLFIDIYGANGTPSDLPGIPSVHLSFLDSVPYFGDAIGNLNLMIWLMFLTAIVAYFVMFRTPFGLRLRSVGEHPRAADTLGLSVYRMRYTGVLISGALASLGGAFLSIGFVNSFGENMTAGAGFIALAALILGNWHPRGALLAALLFGFMYAVADRLPVYSQSLAILFPALPFVVVLIAVAGIIRRPRPPASIGIPYVKQ
ncbi:MAG: hypothetical protein AB7R33_03945 [Thermoleophilia bacterium]